MHRSSALIAVLMAIPAAGQLLPVDLAPRIEMHVAGKFRPVTLAHAGEQVSFTVGLTNFTRVPPAGVELIIETPITISRVDSNSRLIRCSGTHPVRCQVDPDPDYFASVVFVSGKVPLETGTYTASATVTSNNPDPRPENNTASLQIAVSSAPDLSVSTYSFPNRLVPSTAVTSYVAVTNWWATPVRDVVARIDPTGGATISAAQTRTGIGECMLVGDGATCRAAALEQFRSLSLEITLVVPDRLSGGRAGYTVTATEAETDFDASDNFASASAPLVRGFLVRNVADSGEGSLRQAVLDATNPCRSEPCSIIFRIPPPVPERGWFTIALESPLPAMPAFMDIEGSSQTTFAGDTNPDGPEIEIRGDKLAEGDGLVFRGICEAYVSGLAINGFPQFAITLEKLNPVLACRDQGAQFWPVVIEKNVIGLDPPGRIPIPNLRGIGIKNTGIVTIRNNLIGGNRRSGIFITGYESVSFEISGNRIGVTSDNQPAGNGASGIYIGSTNYGGDIADNVIAYSGEFGVARASDAYEVGMHRNLIYGSGLTAIDAGLDLETPNIPDDSATIGNHPVLFSAFYDPATDTTKIRGRLDSERRPTYPGSFLMEFFASSSLGPNGHAQAERYIGASAVPNYYFRGVHADFEFSAKGDLRGQWIAATASRSHIIGLNHRASVPDDTSELSPAIQVTP